LEIPKVGRLKASSSPASSAFEFNGFKFQFEDAALVAVYLELF